MYPLLSDTSSLIIYIFSFITGTVVGSFLNVCIYRIPREESIVYPSSHCTVCNTPLSFIHNIPVISFLLQKGRCSFCGSPISYSYLIIELITGILTFLLVFNYGLQLKTFIYFVVTCSLIVISVIDIRYMIIPNVITFPGIIIGLVISAILTNWHQLIYELQTAGVADYLYIIGNIPFPNSFVGTLFGGGILLAIAYIYKFVRKIEGMGMGDVKLLAMLGAFLGLQGVIFIIFLSSLLGSVAGISLMIYNRGDLKYAIPYGPFLSTAAIIFMLYDNIFVLFR